MSKATQQTDFWSGTFGDEYVDRNPQSVAELEALHAQDFGVSRRAMNQDFLGMLDKKTRILEVGANVGTQLETLRDLGLKHLYGVEINRHAIELSKRLHPKVDIIEGSGFDLPFRDDSFDLVFTSGVLIHIAPVDLHDIMSEIVRVSKRYVWGFEYYADQPEDIVYRGNTGFLWKRNFADLYLQTFSRLKLVKEKKYPMIGSKNVNQMFLLEKI